MKACRVQNSDWISGFRSIEKQADQTTLREKNVHEIREDLVCFVSEPRIRLPLGHTSWQVPDLKRCMYACFSWFSISLNAKNSNEVKIWTSGAELASRCCSVFPVQESWVFVHRRTTIPFRRDDREYSTSSSELQDSESLYPHREPPQSNLILSPFLVIPYRSHVQDDVLEPDE